MENIQRLLEIAFTRNASDLHLVVGFPPCFRFNGELEFLREEELLTEKDNENLIFSLLNDEQKELLINNKELDFSFNYSEKCRFRINAYYQKDSLAAALRLVPNQIRGIAELGLPDICFNIAKLKQGFVLVTGPTGHGKSTTLAAIVDEILRVRSCHVVMIEDPIEFVFKSNSSLISQRELHQDTHSWANALRAVLREDPDVILIGEMRDYETIAVAMTIAETGHLVFSTLHTNSAGQSIDRILDSFPEETKNLAKVQLSSVLEIVLSQRLVPFVSGGRGLAYELMISNSAIRNTIREGKTHMIDNIIQTSASVGMKTLQSCLEDLYKEKKISIDTFKLYTTKAKEISGRSST